MSGELNDMITRYERVMIIDDSQIDRFIAQKLMKQAYFAKEIIMMSSPRQALDHLQAIRNENELPNLIFLDIRMPDMNGFEFLEEYDRLPELVKRQSIIMLSSTLETADINKAHSNPYVITFVSKPLTVERLEML